MKSVFLAVVLTAASLQAFAATAYHTGRSENVSTVTGKPGIRCEYRYGSTTFWRVFANTYVCPTSVEVQ